MANKNKKSFKPFVSSGKQNIVSTLDPKKLTVLNKESDSKVVSGLKRPISEAAIKNLPNQLKAVLLFNISNGAVNINKFIDTNPSVLSIESEPENNFNFEMLKKIERLSGYEVDKNNNILIKQPIWKTLNKEDYDKLIGREILCRLKEYENQDIGLKKSKSLEVDSYDDYFILVPNKSSREDLFGAKDFVNDNITKAIKDNIKNIDFIAKKRDKNGVHFVNLKDGLSIIDTQKNLEIVDRDNKRSINIGNKKLEVAADLIIDALALDYQTTKIDPVNISGNIIGFNKIEDFLSNPKITSNKQ